MYARAILLAGWSSVYAWAQTPTASVTALVVSSSGSCVDVAGGSSQTGIGLIQWTCAGTDIQRFTFLPISDALYSLRSNSGLCADAGSGSVTAALQVTLNSCSNGSSQKWRVTEATTGVYTIATSTGGGCLDVYAGWASNGTILTTYSCQGSSNQRFAMSGFVPATQTASGPLANFVSTVVIQSSNSCVDIAGGLNQPEIPLIQWKCTGVINQNFVFAGTPDGFYTMRPQSGPLCLDAGSVSTTTGMQVVQRACSGGDSQKWQLGANADKSYAIRTMDGKGCLDVYASRTSDGTIITSYACHPASNESFLLAGLASAQTSTPTITPAAGSYTAPLTVTVTVAVAGTPVYYTVDGSTPSASSALYSSPLLLSSSATVRAIAVTNGGAASAVASNAYAVQPPQTPSPTISPAAGNYTAPLTVTIVPAVAGTPVYYTVDGSTPTSSSNVYYGPLLLTSSATVRAIAVVIGGTASAVASSAYSVQLPQTPSPTISPAAGNYTAPLTVTIVPAVAGTPVYYTVDGSTPTSSSKAYSGPLLLTSSTTVRAIAVTAAGIASSIAGNAYIVQLPATPAPAISPASGSYTSPLTVTITPTIAGTPVFYTTDGSVPTSNSSLYTGSLVLTTSATVKAVSLAAGATLSPVISNAFIITTPTVPEIPISSMVIESSSLCVGVTGSSIQPGAELAQWPCTGGTDQTFSFTRAPDGYYTITPRNGSLCFDAGSGSVTTGLQVVQNACNGGNSQKWKILANSNGAYSVSTYGGAGCLDVYGGRTSSGTILTTYACHDAAN